MEVKQHLRHRWNDRHATIEVIALIAIIGRIETIAGIEMKEVATGTLSGEMADGVGIVFAVLTKWKEESQRLQ